MEDISSLAKIFTTPFGLFGMILILAFLGVGINSVLKFLGKVTAGVRIKNIKLPGGTEVDLSDSQTEIKTFSEGQREILKEINEDANKIVPESVKIPDDEKKEIVDSMRMVNSIIEICSCMNSFYERKNRILTETNSILRDELKFELSTMQKDIANTYKEYMIKNGVSVSNLGTDLGAKLFGTIFIETFSSVNESWERLMRLNHFKDYSQEETDLKIKMMFDSFMSDFKESVNNFIDVFYEPSIEEILKRVEISFKNLMKETMRKAKQESESSSKKMKEAREDSVERIVNSISAQYTFLERKSLKEQISSMVV
jgi:hypothetical protein